MALLSWFNTNDFPKAGSWKEMSVLKCVPLGSCISHSNKNIDRQKLFLFQLLLILVVKFYLDTGTHRVKCESVQRSRLIVIVFWLKYR